MPRRPMSRTRRKLRQAISRERDRLTSIASLKEIAGSTEELLALVGSRENLRALWQSGYFRNQKPSTLRKVMSHFIARGAHPGISFYMHAQNNPDKPALIDGRGRLTFSELNARVNRLARALMERGVGPLDVVAFMLPNSREFIEVTGACGKIGATAVPINTRFKAGELEYILGSIEPKVVIYDARHSKEIHACAKGLGSLVKRPFIATGTDRISDDASAYEETLAGSTDDEIPIMGSHGGGKVLIHTSGTTGRPKAAERNLARGGLAVLAELLRMVPMHIDDVFAVPTPLFHTLAYGFATIAFSLGSTLCLMERFDPQKFLAAIEEEGVTACAVVPLMLRRIVDLGPDVLNAHEVSSMRLILSSGSHLPADVRKRASNYFGPVIYNLYGATEIGWATIARPEDYDRYPGTIGRPAPSVEVHVLGDEGRDLPVGDRGELFVKNRLVFEGYAGQSQDGRLQEGMYSVGDVGWRNEEGFFFIADRKDDMIISGGENVYPAEVEYALEEHPAVGECAVVGIRNKEWGQVLCAYVAPKQGAELHDDELRSFLKARIANFKVPKRFVIVQSLPRNHVGKVLKRELPGL